MVETLSKLPGRVSFGGLRRALGAHPESLSRALRRLEREGVVDRNSDGYQLLSVRAPSPVTGEEDGEVLAELKLPTGFDATTAVDRLAGRWFGSLRWVGSSRKGEEHRLVWSRRDGSGSLILGVKPGALRILSPQTPNGVDAGETEEGAYELLFHALDVLRVPSDPRVSHAVFLTSTPPNWVPVGFGM
ncbi:MAG TPA: hypothetical protein VFF67_06840 [Thermoplasmata archaeon]|nr:hypothetical protein [Thermoplasmata archaeon]